MSTTIHMTSSREIYPDTNNTGSIGTSSYKWANIYATTFNGNLSGTATNADTLDGNHASAFALLSHNHNTLQLTYCSNSYNSKLWNEFRNGTSNATTNTLQAFSIYNDGGPSTYGELLEMTDYNANHWQPQLWFGAGASGSIYYRNKEYNNDTWGAWQTLLTSNNYTSYISSTYLPLSGGSLSGNLTVPSLNTAYIFNNTDMPAGAANLASAASAHKLTFHRNGFLIPYQMDNANDGGFLRCRGSSEDSCIFELGTWDDSGAGETIQFNYYPTTSQITPTYSVSVPKASGTLCLNNGSNASGTWPISISGNADTLDGYHYSNFLYQGGWWTSGSGQSVNDAHGMTFVYSGHGVPGNWGMLTTFEYTPNSGYQLQVFGDGWNNRLYFRNRSSDRGGYLGWNEVCITAGYGSSLPGAPNATGAVFYKYA